jgi:hypothetical protein
MQQKMRQTAEVMASSHADNSNTVGWSNATTAEGYQQLQLLNRKTVHPAAATQLFSAPNSCSCATKVKSHRQLHF